VEGGKGYKWIKMRRKGRVAMDEMWRKGRIITDKNVEEGKDCAPVCHKFVDEIVVELQTLEKNNLVAAVVAVVT
jgi:hypothetical protein